MEGWEGEGGDWGGGGGRPSRQGGAGCQSLELDTTRVRESGWWGGVGESARDHPE